MRHVYECPMRWADLDLLGHVNNVVYVDYLQEARVDLLRSHGRTPAAALVDGLVVVRHEVAYLAPLRYGREPVRIECWVTRIRAASFTMAYEIIQDGRVCARATTVLTPYVFETERPRRITATERELLEAYLEPGEVIDSVPFRSDGGARVWRFPTQVRFSDVDVYGHVNNVKYFEYVQEARIQLMQEIRDQHGLADGLRMVVAQMDVDYKIPVLFRSAPYDVRIWFVQVGRTSTVMCTEILDGETVLARARVALVFFDPRTDRSATPPAALAQALRAALPSEHV